MRIDDIDGIGATQAAKLAEAGVTTTDDLLQWGANKAGRDSLETTTGISGKLILEWVNHADLMRIDGVGSEYSDLLEAAGVDSPSSWRSATRPTSRRRSRSWSPPGPTSSARVPSEAEIAGWIRRVEDPREGRRALSGGPTWAASGSS